MPGVGHDGFYNEEGTFYAHLWSKKHHGHQVSDVWAQVLTIDSAYYRAATGGGTRIYARDIELASIENMVITPESPVSTPASHGGPFTNVGIFVTKEIYPHKDKLDNYASVWIWSASATPYTTGSVWLNIHAFGP